MSTAYNNSWNDTSSSSSDSGGGYWAYRDEPRKRPDKPELKDEILRIITNKYLSDPQFVWFMDHEKRIYDDEVISVLQGHYGLSPFVYDPINDKWRHDRHNIPDQHSWVEGLITDCLEHHGGRIVRANVIKFALTCLIPDGHKGKLTIIVKKGMGLETEDVIDLARLANAGKVWKPDQFKEIEDRICIAAR